MHIKTSLHAWRESVLQSWLCTSVGSIRFAFFGNTLWKGSTKQHHAFLHFRFCFVLFCPRVFLVEACEMLKQSHNHGPETQAQLVNQQSMACTSSAEPASIGFKRQRRAFSRNGSQCRQERVCKEDILHVGYQLCMSSFTTERLPQSIPQVM